MAKTNRVSRKVIEHRLLTALETNKDVVAALLNKSDVELLLQALNFFAYDLIDERFVEREGKAFDKSREFIEDLQQLRDQAFGDS